VKIEQLRKADEQLVATIRSLLPQLTEARMPPTLEQLQEVVATQTLLVARDDDGAILGTLTFVRYRVSSGVKGRIEDVIVEESARGRGVGEALVRGACDYAARNAITLLEAYPSRPGDEDPFTGFESMFEANGFRRVFDEGGRRSIWRREIEVSSRRLGRRR
jgi:GNAT superfamily N-acetyltransferase